MNIMILWSGGVESTSLMKWYLENTDDQIFAHYIKIDNPERSRRLYELTAISRLIKPLERIRPFVYSVSSISICSGQAMTYDYKIHNAVGVMAMYHHNCKQLLRAHSLEDQYSRELLPDGSMKVTAYDHGDRWAGYRMRVRTMQPLLRDGDIAEQIQPFHVNYTQPKQWHMDYLGDLFQHTWSCRLPVEGQPCMKCHSCLERNNLHFWKGNYEPE